MIKLVCAAALALAVSGCTGGGSTAAPPKPITQQQAVSDAFTRAIGYVPPVAAGGPAGWLAAVKQNCALSPLQLGVEGPLLYSKGSTGPVEYKAMHDSMVIVCPVQAGQFVTH